MQPDADLQGAILPDILGEIFTWVIPRTPLCQGDRGQLVCLTLVCKAWRRIALHTHELWGHVQVPMGASFDYDKVIAWLSKARTTPKVVSLVSYNRYNFQDPCPCGSLGARSDSCHFENAALGRFLSSCPALDHLELPTSPSSCFEHLMRKVHTSGNDSRSQWWNSIRSLMLSFGRGYYVEPVRSYASIFTALPLSLTSLDVAFASSDVQLNSRYEIPPPILGKLKTFKVSCHWDITRLTHLLRQCTSVESLGISHRIGEHSSFTFLHSFSQLVDEEQPISLPHLRSLEVAVQNPHDAADLLRQISAPALLDFRIHTTMGVDVSRYLVYLSACSSLRSLTIYQLYATEPSTIAPATLIDILSILPSLTHFALDHITFDANKFLRELQTTHQGLHVAPQLQEIEMSSPGNGLTLKGLLCYVQERCDKSIGPGSMKRIELRSPPRRLAEEYRTSSVVQSLQDLGVVVDIYS